MEFQDLPPVVLVQAGLPAPGAPWRSSGPSLSSPGPEDLAGTAGEVIVQVDEHRRVAGALLQHPAEVTQGLGADHVPLVGDRQETDIAFVQVDIEVVPEEVAGRLHHLVAAVYGPEKDALFQFPPREVPQLRNPGPLLLRDLLPLPVGRGESPEDLPIRYGKALHGEESFLQEGRVRGLAPELFLEPPVDSLGLHFRDHGGCRAEGEPGQYLTDLCIRVRGKSGVSEFFCAGERARRKRRGKKATVFKTGPSWEERD